MDHAYRRLSGCVEKRRRPGPTRTDPSLLPSPQRILPYDLGLDPSLRLETRDVDDRLRTGP